MKRIRPRIIATSTALCGIFLLYGLAACAPEGPTPPSEKNDAEAQLDASVYEDMFPNEYRSWVLGGKAEYSVTPVYGLGHGKIWAGYDAMNNSIEGLENVTLSCVSCHSSKIAPLVEKHGDQVANLSIDDYTVAVSTGITCYSCHKNDPGEIQISKWWIEEEAKAGGIETDEINLACAQCHSHPDWSNIDTNPDPMTWSTLGAGTNAESVYNYFLDEGIDTPEVVVTENEFAQYYGSTMEQAGATCSDCHMEDMTSEEGTPYNNHIFTSVLHNENLWNNCSDCHSDSVEDRKAAVEKVKEEYNDALNAATKAVESLGAALEASDADNDAIKEATALYNKASFFLSWGTDAGNGVHSIGNDEQRETLSKALEMAQQGIDLLE